MDETIREKTEQVLTPLKAELIWFVFLIISIIIGISGMKVSYNLGFRHGVYTEKIGDLEDVIFNNEVKHAP